MVKTNLLAAAALSLLLAACASPPPQSTLNPPTRFAQQASSTPAAPTARWWGAFDDPQLDALIAASFVHNRDLRLALERLERARGLGRADANAQWPSGSARASFTRGASAAIDGPGGARVVGERVGASIQAQWELDLFGRLRSAARAGALEAEASEADVAALRTILLADLAASYFTWQGLQAQYGALAGIVNGQRRQVELAGARLDLGSTDELELRRARGELNVSEARLTELRGALAQEASRIAVLAGRFPAELALVVQPQGDGGSARAVTVPTPQWTLEQRPDVAAARARLGAAVARSDSAWAELLPRLTIGGSIGVVAGRGSDLSSESARAWALQPALSIPLLDLLQLAPLRAAREAEARMALAAYEQAVLVAVADVEAGAAALQAAGERVQLLASRRDDTERVLQIVTARFAAGAVDQLALIDAERDRRSAALALAEGIAAHRVAVVNLYRAIGAPALSA
jgi:NodT family efflux transporter outer membrane factor (OMF) lipoprotein